jgi:hypothetical protein
MRGVKADSQGCSWQPATRSQRLNPDLSFLTDFGSTEIKLFHSINPELMICQK